MARTNWLPIVRWAGALSLIACLGSAGGFIVLPFLILQIVFQWLKKLYRWLERALYPERVAARLAEAALPSESDWVKFGEGRRRPLSSHLRSALRRSFPNRDWSEIARYSYEERRSRFPGARADVVVYDEAGRSILRGRKPLEGGIAFWLSPEAEGS